MKEIPTIFSTMMVQAMLQGRKTNTRRIVKPQPDDKVTEGFLGLDDIWRFSKPTARHPISYAEDDRKCPYGKPGDILWVRESWRWEEGFAGGGIYTFKADNPAGKWKTPIFMPKEAARIWLRVKEVRVERLHGISDVDAIDEGVLTMSEDLIAEWSPAYDYLLKDWKERKSYGIVEKPPVGPQPKVRFEILWKSVNGEKSWDANPWVWAIKFEILSTNGKPTD